MKDRRLEEKPGCSDKRALFPEEIACPQCGIETEIWNDETEASCKKCGTLFIKANIASS